MKIICTQENLRSGLMTAGRIVSSTNSLPILNNLLLKTENGVLKISSTNLEIAITTQVRCKVEEDGGVTVVGKTINELVNNLPNKNLSLESVGGDLKIETENNHTSIKTLPIEEFPIIPKVEGLQNLNLDSQELKTSIDQVVFAASSNQTQPEISGVLFGFEGDDLKIVATDRYRLAEKKLKMKEKAENPKELIIPQKTALEISRIIGNQKGLVEIAFNDSQLVVNFNDSQITSRLVDGQYPDYKQIIPTTFKTIIKTEKAGLVRALKAAAVFSQAGSSVRFEFDPGQQLLVLNAESSELGKSRVELTAKIDGDGVGVVLNYHYILDCLSAVESSDVTMKIIDDNSPSLIVPENNQDYLYLVMPIKS